MQTQHLKCCAAVPRPETAFSTIGNNTPGGAPLRRPYTVQATGRAIGSCRCTGTYSLLAIKHCCLFNYHLQRMHVLLTQHWKELLGVLVKIMHNSEQNSVTLFVNTLELSEHHHNVH